MRKMIFKNDCSVSSVSFLNNPNMCIPSFRKAEWCVQCCFLVVCFCERLPLPSCLFFSTNRWLYATTGIVEVVRDDDNGAKDCYYTCAYVFFASFHSFVPF